MQELRGPPLTHDDRARIAMTLSGIVTAANQAATDLLQLSGRFLVDRPFVLRIDRAQRRPFLDLLGAIRRDGDARTLRCGLAPPSGPTVDVQLEVMPQGSDPPTLLMIIREVSQEAGIEEQARRLAVLEAEQREVTRTLDAALEPRLIDHEGAVLGVARRGADPAASPIGGDVHDWQRLGGGVIHLCVVDATGRGLLAARVAQTVRSTARVLALSGCPFEHLLDRTETACLLQEPAASATAVLVRYDAEHATALVAAAGHPPPLVRRSSGDVDRVEVAAPPLGYGRGHVPRPTGRVHLDIGDALVLYTDGVVEAPSRTVQDGIEALARRLESVEPSDVGARGTAQELLVGAPEDDDALVLVLVHASATVLGEQRSSARFHRLLRHPGHSDVPPLRHDLADWLVTQPVRQHAIRRALLVVSELATNAVEANTSQVEVTVDLDDDQLAIEVVDDGRGLQPERLWWPATAGGHGLRLVDAVCSDVRLASSPAGTVVRAKIRGGA